MKTKITTIILASITLNISLWGNIPPQNAPTMLPPAGTPVLKEKLNFPDIDLDLSKYVDLREGLIAHYPFSGNSEDESGNKNHLENNEATLTLDRFGMKESAYAFDGNTSHLLTDIENRKGDFSISLWAKAAQAEQSRFRSVINIHDKTPGSKDTCQIHTSGGRYPTYQFFSSNPESFALVKTEWQQLAVSVSGKVIRFYENGEKVYSQELEGGEANKFAHIIIGKNRHGGAKYDGSIDDVYVYDRAINDAEVARLFDGGFEDSDGDGLTDGYEIGKSRYKLVAGSFDWKMAKEDAEQKGGHLATITSEEEWEAIKNAVNELPRTYWLGGTDEKTEGTWEWITGEVWKFTKWAKDEPNNLGDEDYLQTWGPSLDGNREWNDNQFNETRNGYVLEYGYYTDPYNPDSDGDGVSDGEEVAAKTDPNNPFSRPVPNLLVPSDGPGAPPAPDYISTVTELTERVEELTALVEANNREKARRSGQIHELNATNAVLTAQVDELIAKLSTSEEKITALQSEKEGLVSQVKNLGEDKQNLEYNLSVSNGHLEEAIRVAETPMINGWIYDPIQGWLFTDADTYPLVYGETAQGWFYYEIGSSAPRLFFNYTTEQWEAWDSIPSNN
jgi:hypothetical protein